MLGLYELETRGENGHTVTLTLSGALWGLPGGSFLGKQLRGADPLQLLLPSLHAVPEGTVVVQEQFQAGDAQRACSSSSAGGTT